MLKDLQQRNANINLEKEKKKMKAKSINVYSKNDKKVVVVKLENGEVVFLNYGLVKYAMEHIKISKNYVPEYVDNEEEMGF